MDDTILIRTRAKVAGMQPGQVDRLPRQRAQALIDGGYAKKVEALSDRRATERPVRNPSNQSGGTLGNDTNPIPPAPLTPHPVPDAED